MAMLWTCLWFGGKGGMRKLTASQSMFSGVYSHYSQSRLFIRSVLSHVAAQSIQREGKI